jgi:hypothetical protein
MTWAGGDEENGSTLEPAAGKQGSEGLGYGKELAVAR